MQLIYQNSLGRVCMRGGIGANFNITNITGLSVPDTEVTAVRYPDVRGQVVTRISTLPRTITVSGDINDKNGMHASGAATVFSTPGTLFVSSSRNTRKIACRCTSFELSKRCGIYIPFTLQLIADDPYFQDVSESCVHIAKRTDLLTSSFTLPAMFSVRECETNVINRGSVHTEPVFEISAAAEAHCPNGITIKNNTTDAEIKLATGILANETVTVDVGARKITSSVRGNILNVLDGNSILSKNFLTAGVNRIRVTAENEPQLLIAVCRYHSCYTEAVL